MLGPGKVVALLGNASFPPSMAAEGAPSTPVDGCRRDLVNRARVLQKQGDQVFAIVVSECRSSACCSARRPVK